MMVRFYLLTIMIGYSFFVSSFQIFGVLAKLSLGGRDYHVDTYQDYLAFMDQINRSTDPELVSYRAPISEWDALARACPIMPSVMLTTNFFIGARHVVGTDLNGVVFTHHRPDAGSQKAKFFHHPTLDLTLFTTFKHYPNLTPMKRYFGSDLSGSDFYAYSYGLHHRNRSAYYPVREQESTFKGLYTKGSLVSTQNAPIVYLRNPYQGPKLSIFVVGGDSSGPVFKRVSHTGDVFEDFRYFGFNNTGNPDITVVNASSPLVSSWITNTIIAEALETDRPSELIHTPLDSASREYWLECIDVYRDFFIGRDFDKLSYSGGIFMDRSWLIGVSGKDFLDRNRTTIRKIRFSSVNDYVNNRAKIHRLELDKVFDLGNGRSMARLKQPYLGDLPVAPLNAQARILNLLDLLKPRPSNTDYVHSWDDEDNRTPEEKAAALQQEVKSKMDAIMQTHNKIQNIMIKEALSAG